MNIDNIVLDVRPRDLCGEKDVWSAERMDGIIIKVEPDNYDFLFYCRHEGVYARKNILYEAER